MSTVSRTSIISFPDHGVLCKPQSLPSAGVNVWVPVGRELTWTPVDASAQLSKSVTYRSQYAQQMPCSSLLHGRKCRIKIEFSRIAVGWQLVNPNGYFCDSWSLPEMGLLAVGSAVSRSVTIYLYNWIQRWLTLLMGGVVLFSVVQYCTALWLQSCVFRVVGEWGLFISHSGR